MNAVVRIVMLKELRESLRDRRTLLTSLVLGPVFAPLFFILVLKLALARQVAVQDEAVPVTVANAAAAPNFVQSLREAGLTVTLRDGDDAGIRRWIADGDGLVVLSVPANFGERFAAGQPAAIMLYADGADSQAERHAAGNPAGGPPPEVRARRSSGLRRCRRTLPCSSRCLPRRAATFDRPCCFHSELPRWLGRRLHSSFSRCRRRTPRARALGAKSQRVTKVGHRSKLPEQVSCAETPSSSPARVPSVGVGN